MSTWSTKGSDDTITGGRILADVLFDTFTRVQVLNDIAYREPDFTVTVVNASIGDGIFPIFTVTIDVSLIDAVLPSGANKRHQIIGGWRVSYGPDQDNLVYIPPSQLLEKSYVQMSESGGTTFHFSMPLVADSPVEILDPIGDPADFMGPPPGKGVVNVEMIYVTASGNKYVPLVRSGIIDSIGDKFDKKGRMVRAFNGLGRHGRYDNKKIDVSIPPGHGMTKLEVIQQLLIDAGLPETDIAVTGFNEGLADPWFEEIQEQDTEALDLAEQIANSVLYTVWFDEFGVVTLKALGVGSANANRFTLRSQDLLDYNISSTSDGPTGVRVKGNYQNSDSTSGLKTERTTVKVEENYIATPADWKINDTSGNVIASGYSPSPERWAVVFLEERFVTKRGADVVREVTNQYAFYNSEQWVGNQSSGSPGGGGGALTYISGTLVESWTNRGVRGAYPRWLKIYTGDKLYSYNDGGYLTREATYHNYYYQPRWAMASLSGDGTINSYQGQKILFNLDCVSEAYERFRVSEIVTVDYQVNADGYVEVEESLQEVYDVRGGRSYIYNDGRQSINISEGILDWQKIRTTYQGTGESSSQKTTVITDKDGRVVQTTTETFDSYLPASVKLETDKPDDTIYPKAQFAARSDKEPWEVLFESEELKEFREEWIYEVSNPWLATPEEGEQYAEYILRELCSWPVTFTVPVNSLLRVGNRVRLIIPEVEKDIEVYVRDTRDEKTPKGVVTRCAGVHYVI